MMIKDVAQYQLLPFAIWGRILLFGLMEAVIFLVIKRSLQCIGETLFSYSKFSFSFTYFYLPTQQIISINPTSIYQDIHIGLLISGFEHYNLNNNKKINCNIGLSSRAENGPKRRMGQYETKYSVFVYTFLLKNPLNTLQTQVGSTNRRG